MLRVRPALVTMCAMGLVLGSCAEPTEPHATPRADVVAQSQPQYLQCPVDSAQSVTAQIGALGGKLSVGNTSISIPAGAVLTPTTFTLTIPVSPYMMVDITANGQNGFKFLDAATVTIDYSRCPDSAIPDSPLSAWYVDASTYAPLQFMAGVDVRDSRRVVFVTGHLSGYAIAQ
ncbi:MAG TPA: hypothetical protein VF041_05935 [Gemmatimonadaceae bacterium]